MALNLLLTYPGQVIGGDIGYPWGKPRNVSVVGDGTGTPWEELIVRDWTGFFQSLLLASGLVPSNVADQVGASQYLDAVRYISRHPDGTIIVSGGGDFTGGIFADSYASNDNGSILGNGDGTGRNVFTATKFTGAVQFDQPDTHNALTTWNIQGITTGAGFTTIGTGLIGILVQAGGLHVAAGPTAIDGSLAIGTLGVTCQSEVIFSGGGRIRETVDYAPDANHTFAPADGQYIVAKSGTVTATRTWTLNDATGDGAKVELVNWTANTMTIKNQGGSTIATLPALSGAKAGYLKMVWHDTGAGTSQWSPVVGL